LAGNLEEQLNSWSVMSRKQQTEVLLEFLDRFTNLESRVQLREQAFAKARSEFSTGERAIYFPFLREQPRRERSSMESYQERVIAEKAELDAKIEKLGCVCAGRCFRNFAVEGAETTS
jgi:hypothetical protein